MVRLLLAVLLVWPAIGAAPATRPGIGKLPFIEVDRAARQVRVECESVRAEYPLEFYLVVSGGNEYESILRSKARPSDVHLALLMLGLKPGGPAQFDEKTERRTPPHGPPLKLSVRFEKDGKPTTLPAELLMRDIRTKKPAPEMTWVFSGSRVLEGGRYAADLTQATISVVNLDAAVIDLPALVSKTMAARMWECNDAVVPPAGTALTLIIEPAERVVSPPASSAPATRESGSPFP